jgi:hypothetical protein
LSVSRLRGSPAVSAGRSVFPRRFDPSAPGVSATAVSIGLSRGGLPIDVRIIGPFLEDRMPLARAAMVEREFGGFVTPPAFDD